LGSILEIYLGSLIYFWNKEKRLDRGKKVINSKKKRRRKQKKRVDASQIAKHTMLSFLFRNEIGYVTRLILQFPTTK
jgi:hypothetical protein